MAANKVIKPHIIIQDQGYLYRLPKSRLQQEIL